MTNLQIALFCVYCAGFWFVVVCEAPAHEVEHAVFWPIVFVKWLFKMLWKVVRE